MKRPLAYLTAAWSGEPDVDKRVRGFVGIEVVNPLPY